MRRVLLHFYLIFIGFFNTENILKKKTVHNPTAHINSDDTKNRKENIRLIILANGEKFQILLKGSKLKDPPHSRFQALSAKVNTINSFLYILQENNWQIQYTNPLKG